MEVVFGVIGTISLIVGGMIAFGGAFLGGSEYDLIQGAALIGSGLFMLAIFEVIKTLKQIRDAVSQKA